MLRPISSLRIRALPLRFLRHQLAHSPAPQFATSLRDIARNGPQVLELQLSKSGDLVCRQLMCEHVGDACACRLALALERVPKLETLDLSSNQLRDLPDAVFKLSELQHLNLKQNRLQKLSDDVEQLKNLETLDISENLLKTLPVESLEKLEKLQHVKVAGNGALIDYLDDTAMTQQLRDKIMME